MKNVCLAFCSLLLVGLLLHNLAGVRPSEAEAATRIIFSDNFNDGERGDWTVSEFGTGTFDTSSDKYTSAPFSVRMNSYDNSMAMGVSPAYIYDANLSENYDVSFSFLIPDTDNHWFEVFNSHQIYIVIDLGDDLKCYDGSSSCLIDELTANQWHLIEIKAHPSSETYDVYIDSQFKRTCDMCGNNGYENSFRIGDRENTSSDYGQAYWDDFVVTQPVDSDQDGVVDPNDNCPYDYNPNQADRNDDGWGDVCECIAANIDDVNLVDFFDFSILAADWKQNGTTLTGDINGDDIVDNNDLEILAYYWLSNCDVR